MDETPRLAQDELEFEMYDLSGNMEDILNRRAEENYVYVNCVQIDLTIFLAFKKRQSEAR